MFKVALLADYSPAAISRAARAGRKPGHHDRRSVPPAGGRESPNQCCRRGQRRRDSAGRLILRRKYLRAQVRTVSLEQALIKGRFLDYEGIFF